MKKLTCLILAVLPFVPCLSQAAETAQARIWCDSLRFQRGFEPNGLFALDLTTINAGINGELTWNFFSANYDYSAYLELTDWTFGGEVYQGALEVNLPPIQDADGDGFADFFEVAQPVNSVTTSGGYDFDVYGAGTCTATWSRAAGSKDGACVLRMNLGGFPTVFTHSFEVIEYTGPLLYTPGSTNVLGSLRVTQTGNPANVIQGPCQFVKLASDPYNDLFINDGTWTNSAQQSLNYAEDAAGGYGDLYRYPDWPTNYYGWLVFQDGDPNTGEADYLSWNLSIDDANDADHDTIPDFSDDPRVIPARQPKLTLSLNAGHVLLTIAGDVGHVHEIEQLTDLGSTNWQPVQSVALTNDPQTVSFALPAGISSFWRVRAP